jgi:hypothetical protein
LGDILTLPHRREAEASRQAGHERRRADRRSTPLAGSSTVQQEIDDMTLDTLTNLVADLAQAEETTDCALLAATVQELARRRGCIRTAQDVGALARHIASGKARTTMRPFGSRGNMQMN